MRRLQAGDETALEVLVHKYQSMVLSLVRRYLGSRFEGVDDVAQQVFLRIYRGRQHWEPKARVKTWIYSIAVNTSLNEIRRLRSQKNRKVATFTAVFGDAEEPSFTAAEPAAEAGLDENVAARVRAAVDALPDQQRLAVVLSRFHHCSYEEVADAMGTTVPAVKSLLTRAREGLRRHLADLAVDAVTETAAGREKPAPPGRG